MADPNTKNQQSQKQPAPPPPPAKDTGPALVRMMRDPDLFPAPHEADVHPDEVEAWKRFDWMTVNAD